MSKKSIKNLICCLVLMFCMGCSNLQDKPFSTIYYNQGNISRTDSERSMEKRIKTISATTSRVGNNLLHAQVKLQNVKSYSIPIRYKFSWIIDNGTIDDTSSTWKNDTISGGQTITLSDIATDSKTNDFKLELKPLK
ncbi:MAG: YcfL family protein [Opitutae bacterium]|nr:YcfL family protein [Opitutae bacterium]MBT6461783.1 YcfL family protein [Opitutae bacterium]MBT7853887.1 YcfL family protein [Opitutae bacterium]